MSYAIRFTFVVLSCAAGLACAEPEPGVEALERWLGSDVHGELRGEIDGEPVEVTAETVTCKREYDVVDPEDPATWATGTLGEIEVGFDLRVDGIERRYELEFSNQDFARLQGDEVLQVVPFDEANEDAAIGPDEVQVEVQWEWERGDEFVSFESWAIDGRVELHELSGQVGDDGLVIPAGEGRFAAFVELELDEGRVTASLTAPCTIVEVERMD